MFKPTLKRSKNDQLHSPISKPTPPIKSTNITTHNYLNMQKNNHQTSIPQFFTQSPNLNNTKFQCQHIISPLNCWNLQYPPQVKEILNQPIQQVKSRIIGCKYGVYWLLTQNQLHLWRYDSLDNPTQQQVPRRYPFSHNIRAVSIGQLNMGYFPQIAMDYVCQVMAIGFQNVIELFQINVLTLQLTKMQIRIKLGYGHILQKLQITDNNNSILYISNDGSLSRISFHQPDISRPIHPMISTARPLKRYQALWEIVRKENLVFVENIVTIKEKIYVLVRKEQQRSVIGRLSLFALSFFSGRMREEQQQYRVSKQIHIYRVIQSERNSRLKYQGMLSNYQIQKKIRQFFYANQQISKHLEINQKYSSNSITNIYLNKNRKQNQNQFTQKLSIVINYGLFLTLRQNIENGDSQYDNFGFDEQPKTLPPQLFQIHNRECSMAFLMRTNTIEPLNQQSRSNQYNEFEPLLQPKSKILYSLGSNNINLFDNGLCVYLSHHSIQFVKLDRYPGFLMQNQLYIGEEQLDRTPIWCIFSKNEITMVRKSEVHESLLAMMAAMKEVEVQGVASGEHAQQLERYQSLVMQDIGRIAGRSEVCEGLCLLILTIIKNKLGEIPQVDNKRQPILFINSQLKQVIKQQLRIKTKLRNRFRSFQGGRSVQSCSLFSKWLAVRRKDIKLEQVVITRELEQSIWKLFMMYSLERVVEVEGALNASQNFMSCGSWHQSISVVCLLLRNIFWHNYQLVKNMSITELRYSPQKIKSIKISLETILQFLVEKKNYLTNYAKKLMYYQVQISSRRKYRIDDSLNKTADETYDTFSQSILTDKKDQQHRNQLSNLPTTSDLTPYQQIDNSRQQIEMQLHKFISKLLSVIEIYQILAANWQYNSLPTIHHFFTSFSSRIEVKQALLDLFIPTQFWPSPTNHQQSLLWPTIHQPLQNQPIILKYSTQLPQLQLHADIYLLKWLQFIYRPKNNILANLSNQIKLSDLKELSEKVYLEQVVKIRSIFAEDCPLYVKILVNQLEFRKMEEVNFKKNDIQQYPDQYDNKYKENNNDRSIFAMDHMRANNERLQWIANEIGNIREEITRYLKQLAQMINVSDPKTYLYKEKLLDDSIKVLENTDEGLSFIKELIAHLKEANILPEKSYRFSKLLLPRPRLPGTQILENIKPEFMSSFTLLNNSMKKNRVEILNELNLSRGEQRDERNKNGEPSTTL